MHVVSFTGFFRWKPGTVPGMPTDTRKPSITCALLSEPRGHGLLLAELLSTSFPTMDTNITSPNVWSQIHRGQTIAVKH